MFPGSNDDAIATIKNDSSTEGTIVPAVAESAKSQFQDWYCRFLAHFVRIYENSAPMFVHNELMWSTNMRNIQMYNEDIEKGSHGMDDVIGVLNPQNAIKRLSKEEQNWIHESYECTRKDTIVTMNKFLDSRKVLCNAV